MNYRILIVTVGAVVILYLTQGMQLAVNQTRILNPGTVLMILGGIVTFVSGKIADLFGMNKENSGVSVKLSGLGLVILGLIVLISTTN